MRQTMYCWLLAAELGACHSELVAPAAMQFLDVAGDVTVFRPPPAAEAKPSLPAAKTAVKSCTWEEHGAEA